MSTLTAAKHALREFKAQHKQTNDKGEIEVDVKAFSSDDFKNIIADINGSMGEDSSELICGSHCSSHCSGHKPR